MTWNTNSTGYILPNSHKKQFQHWVLLTTSHLGLKNSATDIWFFGIWFKSSLEVTVQSFRLVFRIENDL